MLESIRALGHFSTVPNVNSIVTCRVTPRAGAEESQVFEGDAMIPVVDTSANPVPFVEAIVQLEGPIPSSLHWTILSWWPKPYVPVRLGTLKLGEAFLIGAPKPGATLMAYRLIAEAGDNRIVSPIKRQGSPPPNPSLLMKVDDSVYAIHLSAVADYPPPR